MALQVWLPLNGNLNNQGLSNVTVTNNGATVDNNGKIGLCYSFGSSKYLKLANYAEKFLTYKTFSLSVWFKCTLKNSSHSSSALISGGNWNAASNLLNLALGNFDIDHYSTLQISGSGLWMNGYSYNFYLNTWYHVVLTSGNGAMRAYVNGELIGDSYAAFTPNSLEQNWICIGNGTYTNIFNFYGQMNDVRIYDHCLSQKEVKEISKGLILHYKLDGNDIGITIPRNGGLIPDGVELYDYILSSGTLWIDTGYVPNNTSGIYLRAYCTTSGGNYLAIGCRQTSGDTRWWINYSTALELSWNLWTGTLTGYSNTWTEVEHNYMNSRSAKVNGTAYSVSYPTLANITYPAYLFNSCIYGNLGTGFIGRISNAKITEGTNIVRNFLPCTYLGEPGMWDTVENKFYRNQGTGLFTLGNKITLKEYEYLESSKTQWIDSNFYPNLDSGSELKVQILPSSEAYSKLLYTDYTSTNDGSILWGWDINNSYKFRAGYYKNLIFINAKINNNDIYLLKIDKNIYSINGITVLTNSTINFLSSSTVKLFARKNLDGNITNRSAMRLYYCKLYNDNQLVRDFIPVSYNGTPGLWDKVEWKFYANAGTGDFTLGPEKTVQQDAPIFYDSSGYCNHGSITGTLTTNSDSPRYTAATVFNGSSYINAGRGAKVRDAISVCCWAYMNNWSNYNSRLLSCTEDGGWNFEPLSGKMNFAMGTGASSNSYKSIASTTSLSGLSTGWHYFVGTYDGLNTKIYIDGVLEGINQAYTTKTPIYYNSSNSIFIGAEAYSSATTGASPFFTGKISDIRIYATALSDEDILELYNTSAFVTNNGVFAEYELYEDNLSDVKKTGLLETGDFYENGAESGYALDTDKTRVASNYIISEEFIEI